MDPAPTRFRHFLRDRKEIRLYIRSFVSNREDVADLLQEVGIVIFGHREAPSETEEFRAWCRGIVRNLVLHHWRSLGRYNEVFARSEAQEIDAPSPAQSAEEAVASRNVLAAFLEGLDEQSCKLLTLRYVEGMTSREIAREFRQTPAAIRMRLMRARELIRDRQRHE